MNSAKWAGHGHTQNFSRQLVGISQGIKQIMTHLKIKLLTK